MAIGAMMVAVAEPYYEWASQLDVYEPLVNGGKITITVDQPPDIADAHPEWVSEDECAREAEQFITANGRRYEATWAYNRVTRMCVLGVRKR